MQTSTACNIGVLGVYGEPAVSALTGRICMEIIDGAAGTSTFAPIFSFATSETPWR